MTSVLTLYYNCNIVPRKNFLVESLSYYLQDLTKVKVDDFQYIKHGLNITIKLNLPQEDLYYLETNNLNYVGIKNEDDSRTVYYFVMGKEWRSKETILLNLSMDTINTFALGTDYELTNKTVVKRQHKDRMTKDGNLGRSIHTIPTSIGDYATAGLELILDKDTEWTEGAYLAGSFLIRVYDKDTLVVQSDYLASRVEIVNTLNQIQLVATRHGSTTFSIFFSNYENDNTFISVKINSISSSQYANDIFNALVLEKAYRNIDLVNEGISPLLYGSKIQDLEGDNQSWYLIYMGNPLRCYLTTDNAFSTTITSDETINITDLTVGRYYYILPDMINNANVNVVLINGTTSTNVSATIKANDHMVGLCYWTDGSLIYCYRIAWEYFLGDWILPDKFTQVSGTSLKLTNINSGQSVTYYYSSSEVTSLSLDTILALNSSAYTIGAVAVNCASIRDLDRWEETLYKIIKLPYKPVSSYSGFSYDSTVRMLYIALSDTSFSNEFTSDYNPLSNMILSPNPYLYTRAKTYESKLFHSDYYLPKFVYDSFSFEFHLELYDTSLVTNISSNLNIQYNVTNTINSRFMFTFTDWSTDGKSLQDYDNILVIARNNELPIYNSAYLNYVNNGYNYDVKTRNRQVASTWLGVGLGALTTGISFATGNVVGVAAGVAMAGSTLAQVVGAINTTIQSEQNLQQKLIQLQNQKVSVSGADDVDLLDVYTKNKAKFMLYQVSDIMSDLLYKLFFYTGYADGRMMIPDTSSRTRFNFVLCEPQFNNIANLSEDIIGDLELRWKTGITILHYYEGTWDFSQFYENWEVSLYE